MSMVYGHLYISTSLEHLMMLLKCNFSELHFYTIAQTLIACKAMQLRVFKNWNHCYTMPVMSYELSMPLIFTLIWKMFVVIFIISYPEHPVVLSCNQQLAAGYCVSSSVCLRDPSSLHWIQRKVSWKWGNKKVIFQWICKARKSLGPLNVVIIGVQEW